MSKIKNLSLVFDEKVNINRNAIEHRATWMGLTYKAGVEAGVDAEALARKAIAGTGKFHGENFKAQCADPEDMREFAKLFFPDLGRSTFQIDVTKCEHDELSCEFHYCPLLAAWQKQGFDDETCAKLCDMAMDGDRNIAKAMGYEFELGDTIAQGCPTCNMRFYKK